MHGESAFISSYLLSIGKPNELHHQHRLSFCVLEMRAITHGPAQENEDFITLNYQVRHLVHIWRELPRLALN